MKEYKIYSSNECAYAAVHYSLLSAAFHWVAQHNGFVGQGLKLAQTVSGSVVDRKDRAYCLSMKIFDWKRRQDDSYRLGMYIFHYYTRILFALCLY